MRIYLIIRHKQLIEGMIKVKLKRGETLKFTNYIEMVLILIKDVYFNFFGLSRGKLHSLFSLNPFRDSNRVKLFFEVIFNLCFITL